MLDFFRRRVAIAGEAAIAEIRAREWIASNVHDAITPAEARIVKHDFEADTRRHIHHDVFRSLLAESKLLKQG